MGARILLNVRNVGYKATVSGGADTGFEFSVQTTACRDCRSLFDAAVRLRLPVPEFRIPREHQRARFRKTQETTPTFEVAVSRLPPSGRGLKWVTIKIECPVSPLHRVNAWYAPGKYPRCGNFMENNALPFRYWD